MRYVRAAQFLEHMAHRPASDAAPSTPAVMTRDVTIAGQSGPIRARLYYRADQPQGEGIVVAHGVHYRGIDEARLVPFARGLAESGLVVLTPELSDLADYRITGSGVGVIRDAVRYLAADREQVRGERVGLLGFSFAVRQSAHHARSERALGRARSGQTAEPRGRAWTRCSNPNSQSLPHCRPRDTSRT